MTENTAEALREDYLARLDEAMRELPHGVASDIRAGVIEEFEGIDAEGTAARIAQLGDPFDIAREAQNEVPATSSFVVGAPVVAPPAPRAPLAGTRGFAIVAALTLSFGGFLLPVLGWFVGVVLISLSALWKTWEKVVAIVAPFVVAGVSFLIVSVITGFRVGGSSGSSSAVVTPLVPGLGQWHLLVLLGLLLIPASGLWLLWRLRHRTAR